MITRINKQYFRNTALQDFRAPDFGDYDVLNAVLPSARRRCMKTICWFEGVFREDVPDIQKLQERELNGCNATTLCFNNPDYRNWLLGMVWRTTRDSTRSTASCEDQSGREHFPTHWERATAEAVAMRRASPASAASASTRRGNAASIRSGRWRVTRHWRTSCMTAARASIRWTATTSRRGGRRPGEVSTRSSGNSRTPVLTSRK